MKTLFAHKKLVVAGLLALLVALAFAGIGRALDIPPPGCYWPKFGPLVCPSQEEDPSCDYGRNPEALWPDNPDGHPFERAFCDGLTEEQHKHPLDSPENEGLYCDEVPGCWAYGL